MSVVDWPRPGKRLVGAAIEANHHTANDLALVAGLIRFQARKLPQEPLLPAEEVRGLLQDLSLRVDAIGRLHRLLTRGNEYVTVDLLTYLHEIADAAICSLPPKQTETLLDLEPDCPIAAPRATAVGLVIGEALTNALKYSHPTGVPGKIGIASRRNPGRGLIIEVADAKTKNLLWEGIGNKDIDSPPSNPDQAIKDAVKSIMASFPPGMKKK